MDNMDFVSETSKSLISSESVNSSISSEKTDNDSIEKELIDFEISENSGSKQQLSDDILTLGSNISSELSSDVNEDKKDEWNDVLGSGSLLKKILQPGTENTKPQRLDICTVNYKCTLENESLVEDVKNAKIQLGDLEITQGVDLALALMNVGEKCALRVEPRFAFGSIGLDTRVPSDTSVFYEIELLNAEPEEDIEKLSIAQRKQLGEKKKQRGNWWYGRGECTFAIQCYRRALDYLDEVEGGITEPKSENDDPIKRAMTDTALQELMEDRINVSNNMAVAQMKLGAYDAALQSLQIVLRCQPNNIKALYRKSKILKAKNEIQEAIKYLMRAKELEPENNTIQKEISELNIMLKKHKNYEKELAKRMFNNTPIEKIVKTTEKKTKSYVWASVALSVAVGIAGIVAWRFKFS